MYNYCNKNFDACYIYIVMAVSRNYNKKSKKQRRKNFKNAKIFWNIFWYKYNLVITYMARYLEMG